MGGVSCKESSRKQHIVKSDVKVWSSKYSCAVESTSQGLLVILWSRLARTHAMGIQCQNDMRHAKQFASKALDGNATLMPGFMQQDGGSILIWSMQQHVLSTCCSSLNLAACSWGAWPQTLVRFQFNHIHVQTFGTSHLEQKLLEFQTPTKQQALEQRCQVLEVADRNRSPKSPQSCAFQVLHSLRLRRPNVQSEWAQLLLWEEAGLIGFQNAIKANSRNLPWKVQTQRWRAK